jgi:hypothetical protein
MLKPQLPGLSRKVAPDGCCMNRRLMIAKYSLEQKKN